jgi:multidrug efflux pump subunit AcrB
LPFRPVTAIVPLAQIAKIEYKFEEGLIWHRNRLPTITVRADIRTIYNLRPWSISWQKRWINCVRITEWLFG